MGEDDPRRGHLAHGRGRPAPRSPRPWARTTRTKEKINVKFPKIIIKGDEKWKSPSRDESGPGKDNRDLQGRLESMQVDQTSEKRTLRRRKKKVHKHLKRGVNEKEMEMDSFTKRVLRIPLDKPFEEAYFTHMLWMFFRVTKETEQDIHRMFNQVREKMNQRITLKKKSDPGKFAVPCLLKGIEFPCALCDTGSSISILTKIMADHLVLKIEPSEDLFTFVDYSTRNSGGIIRNLKVDIGNALVPVDFHVLDNKLNMNHSLLLGRAFMATIWAVFNVQTNQLCLILINPNVYYDPVRIDKPHTSSTGVDTRLIAACYCEFEAEY
ncbi:hypothetical protein F2Q69_00022065 [Brassica cretica]|uniref:Aspartic peptidase DDI1-type domain-containing protein n=1 Tax=Brassica cretica TaxID=69181 RepID=A0A8S9QDB3_BRACR|nr:hypothetical protein F2Q69_00022065 [Brassica cretica]